MPRPVLIAIDASPASAVLLDLARRYCRPADHALQVLLAIDPTFAVHPQPAVFTDQEVEQFPAACEEQQQAERAVAEAVSTLCSAGFDCQGHTVPGEPAEVIVSTARSLDCELIIMGHRHLSRLGRLLDPSVSAKVIERVRVPVLVGNA